MDPVISFFPSLNKLVNWTWSLALKFKSIPIIFNFSLLWNFFPLFLIFIKNKRNLKFYLIIWELIINIYCEWRNKLRRGIIWINIFLSKIVIVLWKLDISKFCPLSFSSMKHNISWITVENQVKFRTKNQVKLRSQLKNKK